MKEFHKMDEMEMQINLRAIRGAWLLLVVALVAFLALLAVRGG